MNIYYHWLTRWTQRKDHNQWQHHHVTSNQKHKTTGKIAEKRKAEIFILYIFIYYFHCMSSREYRNKKTSTNRTWHANGREIYIYICIYSTFFYIFFSFSCWHTTLGLEKINPLAPAFSSFPFPSLCHSGCVSVWCLY